MPLDAFLLLAPPSLLLPLAFVNCDPTQGLHPCCSCSLDHRLVLSVCSKRKKKVTSSLTVSNTGTHPLHPSKISLLPCFYFLHNTTIWSCYLSFSSLFVPLECKLKPCLSHSWLFPWAPSTVQASKSFLRNEWVLSQRSHHSRWFCITVMLVGLLLSPACWLWGNFTGSEPNCWALKPWSASSCVTSEK